MVLAEKWRKDDGQDHYFILRSKGEIPGFDGMRGDDLDRGLVVLEQTLVQSFIETYAWPSTDERTKSLWRISKGFAGRFTNDRVKESISRLFGTSFDFGNLDGRIRLGFDLVAGLRSGR